MIMYTYTKSLTFLLFGYGDMLNFIKCFCDMSMVFTYPSILLLLSLTLVQQRSSIYMLKCQHSIFNP